MAMVKSEIPRICILRNLSDIENKDRVDKQHKDMIGI